MGTGESTYEECLSAAYEELVRSWLDEHPEALGHGKPLRERTKSTPPSATLSRRD
jgi:hypothetical protein